VLGRIPSDILLHALALIAYGLIGFTAALALTKRRLLK
jgi:hypothetical protein